MKILTKTKSNTIILKFFYKSKADPTEVKDALKFRLEMNKTRNTKINKELSSFLNG